MASCKILEGKKFHKLHVLGMNDDFWEKFCRLGSETWMDNATTDLQWNFEPTLKKAFSDNNKALSNVSTP